MKKLFTLENALLLLPVVILYTLTFVTMNIDYPIDVSEDILTDGISSIQQPF